MKKLLFLLLFAATGAGAQAVLTTAPNKPQPAYGQYSGAVTYQPATTIEMHCEPYETFTEWEAKSEGNAANTLHSHSWVYAEHGDVNTYLNLTTLVHCPCGCPQTENQARICETCLRHEWRVREYGKRPKEKVKSRYMRLVEGVKDSAIVEIGEGAGNGKIKHQEAGGVINIEIETGNSPKTNGVVIFVKSNHEKMYVSGSDVPEGESFKNNQQLF